MNEEAPLGSVVPCISPEGILSCINRYFDMKQARITKIRNKQKTSKARKKSIAVPKMKCAPKSLLRRNMKMSQ